MHLAVTSNHQPCVCHNDATTNSKDHPDVVCISIIEGEERIVGRTSSLHYYYLAFVVLTYLAYLIAVNTSYISSLVVQTWAYKPLVALD
jgi:hypothetical protein